MPRPRWPDLLALAFALAQAAFALSQGLRPGALAAPEGSDLLRAAIAVGVGRVCLAWLPPSRLGSHAPAELAATLGASYLLGRTALAVEASLWGLLGAADPPSAASLLAPWLGLAALRIATLPGAMVPGHPVRGQAVGPGFRAAATALGLGALALAALGGFTPGALTWISFLALLERALRVLRRSPWGRLAWVAGLLFTPAPLALASPWQTSGVLAACGALSWVPWVRQADRRALPVATLFFVGTARAGAPLLGLAGLLGTCLVALPPQRRDALRALIAGVALGLMTADLPGNLARVELPATLAMALRPGPFGLGWWAVLAALAVLPLQAPRPAPEAPGLSAPTRERIALLGLLLVALASPAGFPGPPLEALAGLFPLGVGFAGAVLLQKERPVAYPEVEARWADDVRPPRP